MNKKQCVNCQKHFRAKVPHHLFCTKKCCDAYNRTKTWESYFRRLLGNSKERSGLSVLDLCRIFARQEGRCALSGVKLTKISGQGVVSTNASIDRVSAGGPYINSNVRLVCQFINSFRGNVSDNEFKWWCERVVENG